MATVTIESVSKSYEKQNILHNVHLKIEKGEFVVIVGPSGCGKSTLLRLIAGLDVVEAGSILINDKCVNQTPPSCRDIAMVFQNYALYPHMTVYDNMAYGLKMRKMNKIDIRKRVESVARMLHLSDCMQRKPSALSGGQRQRVAMGRAIVRKPAVFLFDEPLSNLDFKLRTEMRHEIKKLHQQLNATCIYVTHDQTEAMTMATRVVVLNQGQVEQVGTPRMVYERPDSMFVASFFGHYPMNFISGTLDRARDCLVLCSGVEWPMPRIKSSDVSLDSVVIGIRPEHLRLESTLGSGCFSVMVNSIDDMGSDKLVRVIIDKTDVTMSIRVEGSTLIQDDQCFVHADMSRAIVFCAQSGKRLGGWDA